MIHCKLAARATILMIAVIAMTGGTSAGQAAPRQAQAGRGADAQAGRGTAPRPPQVVSPEVLPDRRVAFRILAPQAQAVMLNAGDIPRGTGGLPPFTKSEIGVWETIVGPLEPGAFRYTFRVDGVTVLDPRNPSVSESNTTAWSLVYVPGSDFMDTRQVPHGAVATITYYSTALDRFRRLHIYTPPGYEIGREKYPVFYLLHGAGDSDDAWTSVGRAGFIMDNLIAAGKARPMIVVMPAGHTSATSFGARAAPAAGEAASGAPRQPVRDEFFDDFTTDIMPYVEKNYRGLTARSDRAIAGLSMGGSQSLDIAFSRLDKFAYIGVFSSGLLGTGGSDNWETNHPMLDRQALKKGGRLIWFSTGTDDSLMARTKTAVEMLKKHGFDPVFKESHGGHTWINWRNYLIEFAPMLFR